MENSLRIQQRIVRNECDLGFVGASLCDDDLQLEVLVEDEIVCFAGPSQPLARRRRMDPRALEGETWVIREKGSATRQLFESWLASVGGRIGRTIELGCPEAVKALVSAGVGFSYMSVHGLTEEIRRKRLVKLPVTGLGLKRPIYLVHHRSKRASPVMEAFLECVRAAPAGREPGGRDG